MSKKPNPRQEIDIRSLPGYWQWVIVLSVASGISLAAWLAGGENPPTVAINWIMDNLTVLGGVSLLLIIFGIYRAWNDRNR